jgi:hypothetical protein
MAGHRYHACICSSSISRRVSIPSSPVRIGLGSWLKPFRKLGPRNVSYCVGGAHRLDVCFA